MSQLFDIIPSVLYIYIYARTLKCLNEFSRGYTELLVNDVNKKKSEIQQSTFVTVNDVNKEKVENSTVNNCHC